MGLHRGGTHDLFRPIELIDYDGPDESSPVSWEVPQAPAHHPLCGPTALEDRVRQRSALLSQQAPVGPHPGSRLDTLAVQMLSSMSAELVEVMRSSMASMLKNTAGVLRFASMCSGSDLIVPLFMQLMARVLQKCEMSCEVVHSFSVERTKTKQAWIRANFLPEALFGDIADMSHACAKDEISGAEVRIPRVHAVVAGLSCKTLSTLNNSTRSTGNILSDQVGCTGRTFAGMFGYVKRHLPPLVILENVRGLVKGTRGRQNIAWLENFAKRLGYVLIYQCFNCVDYGLPQDRPRVWLALVFVGMGQTLASIPTLEHAAALMQSFKVPSNVGFTVDDPVAHGVGGVQALVREAYDKQNCEPPRPHQAERPEAPHCLASAPPWFAEAGEAKSCHSAQAEGGEEVNDEGGAPPIRSASPHHQHDREDEGCDLQDHAEVGDAACPDVQQTWHAVASAPGPEAGESLHGVAQHTLS